MRFVLLIPSSYAGSLLIGGIQGRALQTELLKGMESHLGVKAPGTNWKGIEPESAEPPTLGRTKTVFEMVDSESVRSVPFRLSLPH